MSNKIKRTGPAEPMAEEDKRRHMVTVRFCADEHAQLVAASKKSGESISDLIRKTAAGIVIQERTPAINDDLLVELSKQGNNLNQIARAINSGVYKTEHAPGILESLRSISASLLAIRGAMGSGK